MKRFMNYFETASVCNPKERMLGIEIESLFVNSTTKNPITLEVSQKIWKKLVENHGWRVTETKNGMLVKLSKDDYQLVYELGWNNFELNTPAFCITDKTELFRSVANILQSFKEAANNFDAEILFSGYDQSISSTLILPDERDKIWIELDGEEALSILGHIACVHYNLDLSSVDEGFEFMELLKPMYQEKNWFENGNAWAWKKYIKKSKAEYAADRYGIPPMNNLEQYCSSLAGFNVVMNKRKDNGRLFIPETNIPAGETSKFDMELFLRSVWWVYRLRVRDGKLVLEIRDVPRGLPFEKSWAMISKTLKIG